MQTTHVPKVSEPDNYLEEKIAALERKLEELQTEKSTKERKEAHEANVPDKTETEEETGRSDE